MSTEKKNHGAGRNVNQSDTVFVSEPIGEGPDARRIVKVNDHQLTEWMEYGDHEPRMRDVEVAERLGFAQARDVRKLIDRNWPEGQRPIQRASVARRNVRGGGVQEYVVNEYWLTEAELLKLCARARTDAAESILDEMIRVYMAARRGLLGPTIDGSVMVSMMRDLLRAEGDRIRAELMAGLTGAQAANTTGLVDDSSESLIRARIRRLAWRMSGAVQGSKAWTSARMTIEQQLRKVVRHSRAWSLLPVASLGRVFAALSDAEYWVEKLTAARGPGQMSLFNPQRGRA